MFIKKLVKTAVPEDGRPPRALVLTKLVERYRFEVDGFLEHIYLFVAKLNQLGDLRLSKTDLLGPWGNHPQGVAYCGVLVLGHIVFIFCF